MDQRGTADLAPSSNSGPQEMERIAGSVRRHLLLCPPLTRHLPGHPTLHLLGQPQDTQATPS